MTDGIFDVGDETRRENAMRQWPDNICWGPIHYKPAHNYDGFCLADDMHGIPTFGSVSPTDPVTIRGQHVHIFNYPGQTEAIAKQLVHRWNCHEEMLAALREAEMCIPGATQLHNQIVDAIAKAEGKRP